MNPYDVADVDAQVAARHLCEPMKPVCTKHTWRKGDYHGRLYNCVNCHAVLMVDHPCDEYVPRPFEPIWQKAIGTVGLTPERMK